MNLTNYEIQAFEALCENQGARIEFYCDGVTYQGIIDEIYSNTRQVKLRHAKIVEKGLDDDYMGNLRFKFDDLTAFKVIESSESVNKYPKHEYLINILRNNRPERSDVIAKELYCADESDDEKDGKIDEKFILDLPEHLEHQITKNFAIVDTVEDFHPAVQCVAKEQIIGVSFHGQEISRFGKLTWLCISTEKCSFLFDIQQLGKEAFDNGLKNIFESNSIKKVIHDCRFFFDCLAHQYSTSLNNVFDTRVADFVISVQRYNEKYNLYSYSSLDSLLRTYLNVPQEFIFQRETYQSNVTKRPITNEYLYDLLKSVLYLKLLKEKLCKELLLPFHKVVDFYRTFLVESHQPLIDSLGDDLSRPDRIPKCLLMHGIQTARFQKPQKMENLSLKCMFIHPQTGEVIKPYLGTSIANKHALLLSQQKMDIFDNNTKVNNTHEPLAHGKKSLLSNSISKDSNKPVPYLGSLAALVDSLRKNEKKQELLNEKHIVNEQAASTLEKNSSLINNIPKDSNKPVPYLGSLTALMDSLRKNEKKQELLNEKHVVNEQQPASAFEKNSSLSGISESENFTEDECLLERPNFKQLDQLYHQLVNRMYPNQVKPVTRLVDKQYVSLDLNTDLNSSENMSSNTDDLSESISSSLSDSNSDFSDDIWLKLREETIAENNLYAYDERKVNYLPG